MLCEVGANGGLGYAFVVHVAAGAWDDVRVRAKDGVLGSGSGSGSEAGECIMSMKVLAEMQDDHFPHHSCVGGKMENMESSSV